MPVAWLNAVTTMVTIPRSPDHQAEEFAALTQRVLELWTWALANRPSQTGASFPVSEPCSLIGTLADSLALRTTTSALVYLGVNVRRLLETVADVCVVCGDMARVFVPLWMVLSLTRLDDRSSLACPETFGASPCCFSQSVPSSWLAVPMPPPASRVSDNEVHVAFLCAGFGGTTLTRLLGGVMVALGDAPNIHVTLVTRAGSRKRGVLFQALAATVQHVVTLPGSVSRSVELLRGLKLDVRVDHGIAYE